METSISLPGRPSGSSPSRALSGQVRSYEELQQRIHDDLRAQHPEWIEPNGNCPTCDLYDRRLAELIGLFQASERNLVSA